MLLNALKHLSIYHRADISRQQCRVTATSSSAAPCTLSITLSAMLSCTHNSRKAEQRWPAEQKALLTTAFTTCSGSALESTSMALMPPVSAISGTIAPSLAANAQLIILAIWVKPVNTTPATPGAATNAAPTVLPRPCANCKALRAHPQCAAV